MNFCKVIYTNFDFQMIEGLLCNYTTPPKVQTLQTLERGRRRQWRRARSSGGKRFRNSRTSSKEGWSPTSSTPLLNGSISHPHPHRRHLLIHILVSFPSFGLYNLLLLWAGTRCSNSRRFCILFVFC